MNNIGVDAISFYVPNYYLDLTELAKGRLIDANKFNIGLGQYKMSISPPDEDIVTLGANAAKRLLENIDTNGIDTLLFATESSIDQSKSAGVYLHQLLNLSPNCRVVELKQACYSSTAALQMAIGLVQRKPDSKVLIVAADIARYEFNTPAEPSQGCGAVAFLVTKHPRILSIAPEHGLYTQDVMDFWRPNYRSSALVTGKFSTEMYFHAMIQTWQHYQVASNLQFTDHDFFCYHTPISRLVEKAHIKLAKFNDVHLNETQCYQQMNDALHYSRVIGNSYSAALYISLVSLLDHIIADHSGARIGFYSYGAGCVAEYFNGTLQPDYQMKLDTEYHKNLLIARQAVSFSTYEEWYSFNTPEDGSSFNLPYQNQTGNFRLHGMKNHKRIYKEV